MKIQLHITVLGLAVLLGGTSLHAIKISVPKQYEAQLKQIEEAEKTEQQRKLRAIDEGSASSEEQAGSNPEQGDMAFTVTDGSEEAVADSEKAGSANEDFLTQSIEEAKRAAEASERDAPADAGFVSGQVVDKETTRPVSGVAIIAEGTDIGTMTDSQGRYTLGPAPAGEYTLSFIKSGYIEANVTEYQVLAGEVTVFPFALPPRPAEMSDEVYVLQDFSVSAEEANDMMLKLDLKFDSSRALDVFSSEDFSKFAASDVADAVTKIAGVSVNDGKFPSVRGLNDRYTVTTMNGMPVPSPDPFRKSPQFDLFPSSLLDSIRVSKSATADLSAESTAANFDLITKQLPEEFFLKVSVGSGFHSNSIDEFRTFDRPDRYLLTDGAAGLNQAPRSNPVEQPTRPDFQKSDELGSRSKDAQPNTSVSLSFGDTYELPGGQRLGVVFAGFHKRNTKAVLDATDSQGYQIDTQRFAEVEIIPGFFLDQRIPVPYGVETRYEQQEFTESVALGGLLGLTLEVNEGHRFFANAFTSRLNETTVERNFNGQNPDELIAIDSSDGIDDKDLFLLREKLYFVERSLTLGQVGGSHQFDEVAFEPDLQWTVQKARTTQDEPDFRDTIVMLRAQDVPGGSLPKSIDTSSVIPRPVGEGSPIPDSSNSWRDIQEDEDSARIDLNFSPLQNTRLFVGGALQRADRTTNVQSYFDSRRSTNFNEGISGFGSSQNNFTNGTRSVRSVSDASREIDSFYFGAEYEPNDKLKLNIGLRREDSLITVDSDSRLDSSDSLAGQFSAYDADRANPIQNTARQARSLEANVLAVPEGFRNFSGSTIEEDLVDEDFFPSINLTFTPVQGLRFQLGYFETLTRPSFREISPDIFVDIENGDRLAGNPFLRSSRADNYDFRIEFYPGQYERDLGPLAAFFQDGDMVGVSLFKKDIIAPIEFFRPTTGVFDEVPFNNPEGATAQGIEFEFTKTLGFTQLPFAEHFTIGGNASFTDATATVSDAERGLLGLNDNIDVSTLDSTRPLTEQPDEIFNLNLTYQHPEFGTTATLAYNFKSEILESIGSESSFDAYRGETETLDLIVRHDFQNGWVLSFAVKNLMDEGYETFFRNRAPDFANRNIDNLEDPGSFAADKPRTTVNSLGRSFSFSASYDF